MARNLAPLLGLFQCTYFSSIRAEPSNFLLLDYCIGIFLQAPRGISRSDSRVGAQGGVGSQVGIRVHARARRVLPVRLSHCAEEDRLSHAPT